jgi:DNA repair photolyase
MRWRTEGDDAQAALFPDVARHIGRGEFRGMEFLHVKARSIINTLPASSSLPFRHTINAYRGCSHACTYCFARPTHDYLGLDIDEGFERQVVVKINAVERLRAELDPRRWCGEPIAMGTNTDPYQRAEGKYHLTRGLVQELGRARNPFSILTKSTLVLRDADVLAEAAERTDVTVSFSVGTLDEEVWRATEPGTPPPWKRLEALAALKEKGLRTGVLVAPVLPGLSDTAESLDAVVAAATEAGADSVSGGMLVYLKPGVREVFLGHLGTTHPDLVPRYEAMYRGINAPSAERRRVADLLQQAQARHRGRRVGPPRRAPHRNAPPPRPPAPGAAEPAGVQLGLGV